MIVKALAFMLLALSGFTVAKPSEDFSNIIQNFAHQRGMQYVQTGSDNRDGWSYNFYSQGQCNGAACGGLLVNYRYTTPDQCIDNIGLFGDLPLAVNGRMALFTMPHVTDNSSLLRDFLNVYDDGGCYSITYGVDGSGFNDAYTLAKELVGEEK